MKNFFLMAGIAAAAAAMYGIAEYARTCHAASRAPICGGVTRYVDENAPKTINSATITAFSCEMSTLSFTDDDGFSGYNYKLAAVMNDGAVNGTYERCHRSGDGENMLFGANADFMDKLYLIVSRHDFAKYNGQIHRVAGLPQMYGAMINVDFASGENVYSYDNQENFLPPDALKELVCLFREYADEQACKKDGKF